MRYTCKSCGVAFRFPQWECSACRADFCVTCAERLVQHEKCAAPIRPYAIPPAPTGLAVIPEA